MIFTRIFGRRDLLIISGCESRTNGINRMPAHYAAQAPKKRERTLWQHMQGYFGKSVCLRENM